MSRAAIVASVAQRLRADPAALAVPGEALDIFVVPDFLDAGRRAALIERIDRDRRPSTVFGNPDPGFRTSDSCNLDRADAVVAGVDAAISALLGLAPEHGETVQGQRYGAGQQFKPHHDYFHVDQPYWAQMSAPAASARGRR